MSSSICKFFLVGNCLKGDKCTFKHELPDEMPICTYFLKGNCQFGDKCRFKHEKDQSCTIEYSQDATTVETNSSVVLIEKEEIDESNATKNINKMCPFALNSYCRDIKKCRYLHGYPCEICGKLALHPTNNNLRKEHYKLCSDNMEKDMEQSFRLKLSREIVCGICLEYVIKDYSKEHSVIDNDDILTSAGRERFGLLEGCNHSFCIECIRNWRFKIDSTIPENVKRSCPLCRKFSGFVVPSLVWPENDTVKAEIIDGFKKKVSNIPCKYFNQGQSVCPFGNSCFYQHAYSNGMLADRSKFNTIFYDEDGNAIDIETITISDLINELDFL